MKKISKLLSALMALCISVSLFAACQSPSEPDTPEAHVCGHVCATCGFCTDPLCGDPICADKCEGHEVTGNYSVILTPVEGEADLHTDLQKEYLSEGYNSVSDYANGQEEKSRPKALRLRWSVSENNGLDNKSFYYKIFLSTDETFGKNVWTYTTFTDYADVYNLMINCNYYWKVALHLKDGSMFVSQTSSFRTAASAPRNLYVSGITNVRDLGGWETEDGAEVKQGLLIRCGRLNKSNRSDLKIEIDAKGKDAMLKYLGVKTEIDLRLVDNNEVGGLTNVGPLGSSVKYIQCPMGYSYSNMLLGNRNQIIKIFAILADINNYPIIYHCNIGTDRTGLISFLVNGLVGVPEKSLYRDYLMSNFGDIGGKRSISDIKGIYLDYVKGFDGITLSKKIYNCLESLGVPAENLDSVINIMKTQKAA